MVGGGKLIQSFVSKAYKNVNFVSNCEFCLSLQNDGNPISLQECACKEIIHPKNEKYVSRSYLPKLATISNSEEEGGVRGGGGGNKAIDCSRCRVLVCIACASDRCNAIDTLWRNHVHNKLMTGPEPEDSLDAKVAHWTKNRSDPSDNAPHRPKSKRHEFHNHSS